ncbi:pyocin knob domain-containing protein [Paenibacillus selenitireducens]|uniref:pyocin knob domain-containing protein n=1 Tax=Paenibacillus selenitireducens TaxID=1324314 RepID=UPI0018E961D5|nr:pyocin knob domain-containing protein [Paenibacillus selenitireducens]
MKTTGNLALKKPEGTDIVNIDDLNANMDILDTEVVKKASATSDGRISKEDWSKLNGIEAGANKYVHPANHPPSIIVQDASNRFVSDAEKTAWNSKETPTGAQAKVDAHANRKDNPHSVTVAQIGAETPSGAQTKANTAESNAKSYVDAKAWQKHRLTDDSGVATVIGDLNLADNTGYYMGSNMLNAPTADWYYVEVIRHNPIWCVQKAINFNRDSFYMRRKENGTWKPWSQDLFTSVSDGKNAIAGAIAGKGVPASGSDAFAVLASKIGQINTGKNFRYLEFGETTGFQTIELGWEWQAILCTIEYPVPGRGLAIMRGGFTLQSEGSYIPYISPFDMTATGFGINYYAEAKRTRVYAYGK